MQCQHADWRGVSQASASAFVGIRAGEEGVQLAVLIMPMPPTAMGLSFCKPTELL